MKTLWTTAAAVALAATAFAGVASAQTAAAAPAAAQQPEQAAQPETDRAAQMAAFVEERSVADLRDALNAGTVTSEDLVLGYLRRIDTLDRAGPTLRSVLAVNPQALELARALDAERAAGKVRGPLHGVPVLVKDNIETLDPMPTTAGSLALKDNLTGRDAPAVARLRAAGAVILGKTNLSEWANIRSTRSISGWSATGGQTRNPYALDRNACGSSSGSGAAAAASLAAATVGTETDGSITCPSSINGLVGLKPTVGLVSRSRIVPISHTQDTAGPMTRSVADAAMLLDALAGPDPKDPATVEAAFRKREYAAALKAGALKGKKVGVLRFNAGFNPEVDARFEAALATLRAAGAELVEIKELEGRQKVGEHEFPVLLTELKADLAAYLAEAPAAVKTRTLADVIAFNKAHPAETALFGQEIFEQAEATKGLTDPDYLKALAEARRLAGPEGIDKLLAEHGVSLLVSPTVGPAWLIDPVNGDQYSGGSAANLPAVAGYPHLTVPMGLVRGLPVGLSFIGPAWSEADLLAAGYDYERLAKARRAPTYVRSIDETPEVVAAFSPAP